MLNKIIYMNEYTQHCTRMRILIKHLQIVMSVSMEPVKWGEVHGR